MRSMYRNRVRCLSFRAAVLLVLSLACRPLLAETWYVRPDGGTRYSPNVKDGQCDGKADTAYPGKGTNQHCAFKDARSLWTDGSYANSAKVGAPAWGWIGAGGDTYLLHGSIADGVSYRVGQSGPDSHDYYGLAGDPYSAGAPPPPSGTAAAHTKILGENYGKCTARTARTQLHGGYGVGSVLVLAGASFVDVACLDITDFSSCGRVGQLNKCNTGFPLSDYATNGIQWSNTSTNDTLTDVRVHGLANAGLVGPTGDGVVMTDVAIVGNAGSGWNADPGNQTTGTGSLLVQNYEISWNGCAEEYPIVHALPYQDCTDDESGGYGDGFGTTTVPSHPGWKAHFDQGIVSYNTQDGLDALHLTGAGSSMTVTRTLAFGNMGQQVKVGGSQGILDGNRIFTNCNAMREAIPGTPEGYNKRLSDFCRAADAGVVITVNDDSTTVFSNNLLYSASATAVEVDVNQSCKTSSCLVRQEHNIFLGFRNDAAHGYARGGSGEISNPLYVDESLPAYQHAGSLFDHNTTFHAKNNWTCPNTGLHERAAFCGDPHLSDETWHKYGYADVTLPTTAFVPTGAETEQANATAEHTRSTDPFLWGSLGVAALASGGWFGWRRRKPGSAGT